MKEGRLLTKSTCHVACFDKIADPNVMRRLTRWLTQNSNESIHNRLFHIISKTKYFRFHHVNFAAYITGIIHNVGYEQALGKLHKHMGVYYEEEKQHLKGLDDKREIHSQEKHQTAKKKSRYAQKPPLKSTEIHYSAGFAFEDYEIQGVLQFEASLVRATEVADDLQRDDDELELLQVADDMQRDDELELLPNNI